MNRARHTAAAWRYLGPGCIPVTRSCLRMPDPVSNQGNCSTPKSTPRLIGVDLEFRRATPERRFPISDCLAGMFTEPYQTVFDL